MIEKRTVGEYSGQTNEERYEKEKGHAKKLLVKVKLPLSLIKHQTMNIWGRNQAIERPLNTQIQGHLFSYPNKYIWGKLCKNGIHPWKSIIWGGGN